jgi:4-hydroxy-3-polyprenylbenzoate decarboxylase
MEKAQKIWEELKLPKLTPPVPWHGYQLGYLPDDWNQAAQRAVRGEYLKTGEEFRKHRTLSSYFETGVVVPPGQDKS